HMAFEPARPHNELPSLPPPLDVETKAVLKACVEARSALACRRRTRKGPPRPLRHTLSCPGNESLDKYSLGKYFDAQSPAGDLRPPKGRCSGAAPWATFTTARATSRARAWGIC